MAEKLTIILTIDLGTVTSGAAWAPQGSDGPIQVITAWSGCGDRVSRTPSVISLSAPMNGHWGYLVKDYEPSFRGLKALFDSAEIPTRYPPSLETKDLMARHHTTHKDVANTLGPLDYDTKVVVTVPEGWSEEATAKLGAAAAIAGLDQFQIVLDFQAALHALRDVEALSLDKGDTVIVCDAGGNSDLISYQIELEPLRLAQVSLAETVETGSAWLDFSFEAKYPEIFGPESLASAESKMDIITGWNTCVKPIYTGDYAQDFSTTGPQETDNQPAVLFPSEAGNTYLAQADIDAIFEDAIRAAEMLVSRQLAYLSASGLSAKAVLLVGGFACSKYLVRRLQQKFPDLKLIQPPDPGALYHGLELNPKECRIATHNYGILHPVNVDGEEYKGRTARYDEIDGHYWIEDANSTFIRKGRKIVENVPIRAGFYRAPVPIRLCTLKADLSKAPREHVLRIQNPKGNEYYHFHFELVCIPKATHFVFELQVEGVPYGKVEVRYEVGESGD
ncbi:hypothetical protein BJY01DRAFT_256381 [Aspergillus pseudoustus]|uniref:Actin-like ATPase domain-containing protein n=1 Tax=Aspergillus pseudoustus TaxID=1810923 RepID=A0ABR4IB58_9EURO